LPKLVRLRRGFAEIIKVIKRRPGISIQVSLIQTKPQSLPFNKFSAA
jgi:hypothetical protein